MNTLLIWVTALALITAPLHAQQPVNEAEAWRSLAATLQPGTFIDLHLKGGEHFKGTFVQQLDGGFVVKPHTRMAVDAREVGFADVESIRPTKPGKSPGTKVLIGVGVGVGAIFAIALAIFAAMGGD